MHLSLARLKNCEPLSEEREWYETSKAFLFYTVLVDSLLSSTKLRENFAVKYKLPSKIESI